MLPVRLWYPEIVNFPAQDPELLIIEVKVLVHGAEPHARDIQVRAHPFTQWQLRPLLVLLPLLADDSRVELPPVVGDLLVQAVIVVQEPEGQHQEQYEIESSGAVDPICSDHFS